MNKLLKITAICISVVFIASTSSCSSKKEEPIVQKTLQEPKEELDKDPFKVSPEEANAIIQGFLNDSKFRSTSKISREVDFISEISSMDNFRSSSPLERDMNKAFYIAQFKEDKGYAFISKDKRTFPIFAVLDDGRFSTESFYSQKAQIPVTALINGHKKEINDFNRAIDNDRFRNNNDNPEDNWEDAVIEFMHSAWVKTRGTENRLQINGSPILWGQHIDDRKFLNSNGVLYRDAYYNFAPEKSIHNETKNPNLRSSKGKAIYFGCTPVAYGQVLYALSRYPGYDNLKYTNGEPVLWDRMSSSSYSNTECQRFLGWITENCDPTYFTEGTMVYNITARKFVNKILPNHVGGYYDNCVASSGDFNGYGRSEDEKASKEFFTYPSCFIIMTASAGSFNYWSYHTFVIDGMLEYKKTIETGFWPFDSSKEATRHLYHINAGWEGDSNGYYLYVQDVGNEFGYTGKNDAMDYRSKVAYCVIRAI